MRGSADGRRAEVMGRRMVLGSIPTGGTALRPVHSTGAACQAHRPVCTVGVLILDGVFMWFALGLAASAWGVGGSSVTGGVHMWCISMHIIFNPHADIAQRSEVDEPSRVSLFFGTK